nr:Gp19/Gp15/Gp42 family protein [Mycobacterium sp. GA-1199]
MPDLAAQIDAGDLDEADVVDIEAEAVLRVVRNPEGLFSEQDGSYGYQLSREAADNSLRITAEEWERLGIKPSRMFQIVPRIGGRR